MALDDTPTRVLLVEDNRADARLLRELLADVRRPSFALTTVGTLCEARAAVAAYDVVLLDLSLPDAFGTETITGMVAAAGEVPVIILTGTDDDQLAVDALQHGADDYLLKDEITPSLLARTILYAVERRRSTAASRRVLALEVARAESLRAAERARVLADLTEACAAHLDPDDVLRAACARVRPPLAEAGVAHVVRADGRLERVADVTSPALEGRLRGLEDGSTGPSLVAQAVAAAAAVEPADRGEGAARVLPLCAQGRVVGALTLVLAAGQRFDDERRTLADEAARRLAVAVDAALLHQATERALRTRDEVLAIVSHDLRNPLSVFGLVLQAIRRAADAGAVPPVEVVTRGTRAVARMARLIDDLLDVARIDAGTLAITRAPVDLRAILREAIEHDAGLAAAKRIRLEADLPVGLEVDGDRDRLLQVVANLLGNAIKFTPADGRIVVTCGRRGDAAHVSVVDTGPGVPADSRAHVFDRFYQSDRRRGGVGLGLAIAKGIIDAHGGAIGVDAADTGGARFWFELPLARAITGVAA